MCLSRVNGPMSYFSSRRNKFSPGPMMRPNCLTAIAIEKAVVLSFFVVVRESSPNIAAPAPAPIPVAFRLVCTHKML